MASCKSGCRVPDFEGNFIVLSQMRSPWLWVYDKNAQTKISYDEIAELWRHSDDLVPDLSEISKIKPLKKISMVVSGGTPMNFDEMILRNHLAWAYSRSTNYIYFKLSDDKSDYVQSNDPEVLSSKKIMGMLGEKQPYWAKVAILKQLLASGQIPEDGWVVWIDNDVVFNDFDDESVLDSAVENLEYTSNGDKKYLIAFKDGIPDTSSTLTTGFMWIKNNKTTRQLLDQWWQLSDHEVYGFAEKENTVHEQDAINRMYHKEKVTIDYGNAQKTFDFFDATYDQNIEINTNFKVPHPKSSRSKATLYRRLKELYSKSHFITDFERYYNDIVLGRGRKRLYLPGPPIDPKPPFHVDRLRAEMFDDVDDHNTEMLFRQEKRRYVKFSFHKEIEQLRKLELSPDGCKVNAWVADSQHLFDNSMFEVAVASKNRADDCILHHPALRENKIP